MNPLKHLADLVQRVYYEKSKGSDENFNKLFSRLHTYNFDFEYSFEVANTTIHWTCFESSLFSDIILEDEKHIYFYFWNRDKNLEAIIPAGTYDDQTTLDLLDRNPGFADIWVIGDLFPGLSSILERPIKVHTPIVRKADRGPIRKMNFYFKKMFDQFASNKKPIFQKIDYSRIKDGEKHLTKIVDKKKARR